MRKLVNWDCITDVEIIGIKAAIAGTPVIYANGRHQSAIRLTVLPLVGAQQATFDKVDLSKHVKLFNYATGEELGTGSSQNWHYSYEGGGCPLLNSEGEVVSQESSRLDENTLEIYVSCSKSRCTEEIKVGVELSLVTGKIFTAPLENSEEFICFLARPAIDFSHPNLWYATTNYETVVKDLNVRFRLRTPFVPAPWADAFVGVSRAITTTLHCNVSKSHKIEAKVAEDTVSFEQVGSSFHGEIYPFEEAHSLSLIGRAHAYAGWNHGGFSFLTWHINPDDDFGVEHGELGLVDTTFGHLRPRMFHIGENDNRHRRFNNLETSGPGFYVCTWELFIASDNLAQANWENQVGVRFVEISDNFGNEGELALRFDYNSYWPTVVEGDNASR